MDEEKIRQIIRDELERFILPDKYVFDRQIQILDGRKVQLGKSIGNIIGTESTQKIGFLGATPSTQLSKIADPTGGLTNDGQARTAINSIIDALEAFGFTSKT